ncbi:hypothetical_protein [Leishmania braziliensis MHOM/BR/75/M2904]|nr:hypothetical_protein [Leishmania braziliensis MHOM/BR/75/M2904]
MTSNPYIAQHYGSSMEVISNGHGEQVDAVTGFRRFPNTPHMTHIVFRPSKSVAAPSTTVVSPSTLGIHNTYKGLTPNALVPRGGYKGPVVDDFPSRPQTPRSTNSIASLPPLLPADRPSVGPSEAFRERGVEHFREWVTGSTRSSASTSDSGNTATAAANDHAPSSLELASASAQAPTCGTESDQRRPSTTAPPGTLALEKIGRVSSDHGPSVSLSPESLHFARSPNSKSPFISSPALEVPTEATVDAALHRLRDALAQAQCMLDKSRASGGARALPPPPTMPSEFTEPAQHQEHTAAFPTPTFICGSTGGEMMQEDSLDCVSPLLSTHAALHTSPSTEQRVSSLLATSFTSPIAKAPDVVAVPDETRFMVLCTVTHPSAILNRRLRHRGPVARASQEGLGRLSTHSLFPTCAEAGARGTSPRRIAEVQRSSVSVGASPLTPLMTTVREPQRSPSPNAGSDGHPSSRTSTQRRPTERSVRRLLHKDPSLIPGLAEFLRAGNPNGFSSLNAATHTKTSTLANASSSARGPHRRPGPPVAAASASTVPLGHAPQLLLRRDSSVTAQSQTDCAVTSSSHLPYTPTEGSAAVMDVSPRRERARARRIDSIPSYAQPTLSWLSKGSEASADEFPVSRVASPQTSPLKDLAAAPCEGALSQHERQ